MDYGDSLLRRLRPRRAWSRLRGDVRRFVGPLTARVVPIRHESFCVAGRSFPYFVHPHNVTWRNERAVEIPLAIDFLSRCSGRGLEFGNVLSHYRVSHGGVVLDKYERTDGVLNLDVVDFDPGRAFDWIVSISTLEHVGWDERPRDEGKSVRAFHLLRSTLSAGGRLFLTVPFGHNSALDSAILGGELPTVSQTSLVKERGRWFENPSIEWRPYSRRDDGGAESIWVAQVGGIEST